MKRKQIKKFKLILLISLPTHTHFSPSLLNKEERFLKGTVFVQNIHKAKYRVK